MTELTLDNYKEENNAHVILIRMFSDMKKKLIGMSFTTPEEYKIFYDTILFYRDKIHDFYFDNIEQLGEVFTHVEEGDEHNEEKVGEYSALHKLLTEEHKNGHGSIQYIDFKESETFSLHHVFISLIYGKNGVVRGYLDEVYMNGDREIEESLRDLHLYYLSQLLWSIATIEEEAQHEGLIDYTQGALGNTLSSMHLTIGGSRLSNEWKELGYETIDTIMDHIFVLNPDYQGNIFLGYDRENNTIQSHADKKRIWKAIDDGDETQRLQTPESEVEGIARPSAPAIQILIKETPEFSQVAKERIKEYRKDHHLPEITLERSDAEKTVAQKRNEKLFYRISDMVLDKLQTLPKDVLIQEIDKAISILLRPIGYKWRNKHHRNYYLKAFKGKLGGKEASDNILKNIVGAIWINPDKAHERRRERNAKVVEHYDATDKAFQQKRDEELAKLQPEIDGIFYPGFDLSKSIYKAMNSWHMFGQDRISGIINVLYLFETSPDTTNKDEVVSIVKKFFDIRDLISDTKEQILDLVDIINATEKLRLLEKEVQEKYNIELFTEENIQRLVYQNQLYMSDNLTMTFSGYENGEEIVKSMLMTVHEVFSKIVEEKGLSQECLINGYSQFYFHQRALGIDNDGLIYQLHVIVNILGINIPFDKNDLQISLQNIYDSYMSHIVFMPGKKPNPFYENMAKAFGINLALRKPKTLEDHFIEQTHTPVKIGSVDPIGESYKYRTIFYDKDINVINNTQRILQEHGSLLLPEKAISLDIRSQVEMPDEMKVDIDVMVPVSANLSKVRMITRGFRKPNGTMEGNYLLSYSANSQQFTLIYDTTLRTHIDIASYYNINTASILGGGYATINKFSQHILLESYMPGAFHEPRIISSVAFKNAFRQLLPNAKIVIGDDGMQNMDKYRKDELGENYKEKYENNNESNGEGDDLPF